MKKSALVYKFYEVTMNQIIVSSDLFLGRCRTRKKGVIKNCGKYCRKDGDVMDVFMKINVV